MTERAQRQRVAIRKVGSRGSRAEMLRNSPVVIRDPCSDTVKELLRDNSKISIEIGRAHV